MEKSEKKKKSGKKGWKRRLVNKKGCEQKEGGKKKECEKKRSVKKKECEKKGVRKKRSVKKKECEKGVKKG